MKTLLFALTGALLIGSTVLLLSNQTQNNIQLDDNLLTQWKQFKSKYGKRFADPDFESYRIQVFAQNLKIVENDTTGTFGVTQFFDLTPAEFAEIYLTLQVEEIPETVSSDNESQEHLDISINWVNKGAVSKVKNQMKCGSCWAFSVTGTLESALIVAGQADQSIDLSEQQLIDCNKTNQGCKGGFQNRAFKYLETHPLTTEKYYPYQAISKPCQKDLIQGTLYSVKSYTKNPRGNVNGLKKLLLQQPVSVAVDATNWHFYKSGVFSDCKKKLNHAVVLVGFENGAYLLKNSWGTTWGEQGFIRLADGNTCGLALDASVPIVNKPSA